MAPGFFIARFSDLKTNVFIVFIQLNSRRVIMKFKTIMVIKAIVCLVFFPIMLFLPAQFFSLMGVTLGAGAAFLARVYGATLVGNMLLTWFGRNAEPGPVRQAIVLDAFFYDLIGFITVVIFYLNGTLNTLGIGAGLIYLFLTVGFGLFLFPKK
jgi:hypothetical protein